MEQYLKSKTKQLDLWQHIQICLKFEILIYYQYKSIEYMFIKSIKTLNINIWSEMWRFGDESQGCRSARECAPEKGDYAGRRQEACRASLGSDLWSFVRGRDERGVEEHGSAEREEGPRSGKIFMIWITFSGTLVWGGLPRRKSGMISSPNGAKLKKVVSTTTLLTLF